MKTYKASLLNAMTLLIFGLWGALPFITGDGSPTALIPVIFGLIFIVCNNGLKKENKVISHLIVMLTLIVCIALFMPLMKAFGRADSLAIMRISVMIVSSMFAIVTFIKSFISARRNKSSE